jgi:hypothetical protein
MRLWRDLVPAPQWLFRLLVSIPAALEGIVMVKSAAKQALQAIRALIGENLLLRDALIEISGDPTGISTYQAEIARQALRQAGYKDEIEQPKECPVCGTTSDAHAIHCTWKADVDLAKAAYKQEPNEP